MVKLLAEAVCITAGYTGVSETHRHARLTNLLLLRVFRVDESRPEPLWEVARDGYWLLVERAAEFEGLKVASFRAAGWVGVGVGV
jgi:hypothetical protein